MQKPIEISKDIKLFHSQITKNGVIIQTLKDRSDNIKFQKIGFKNWIKVES